MDQEQSIALWQEGKEAWNEWAEDMLAQRKKLEENGEWKARITVIGRLEGLNEETIAWIEEANVDFSSTLFLSKGETIDKNEADKKPDNIIAISNETIINFEKFIFPNDVYFDSSEFTVDTVFGFSKFSGNTMFINSKFIGNAIFIFSKFSDDAYFSLTHFEKLVSFKEAEFEKEADFSSITSKKSFNLINTKFTQVPDFTESAFHAPPVLDDMEVREPLDKGWRSSRKTDARKFRALGKMAGDANDNQNAMEFFANEVRAKRGFQDKAFDKGSGRFWWGLFYDWLSDFGRSFWRPIYWWIATVSIFASFYYATSIFENNLKQVGILLLTVFAFSALYYTMITLWRIPWLRILMSIITSLLFVLVYHLIAINKFANFGEALYIAIRHGLVFSGLSRSDRWDSAIKVLYGVKENGGKVIVQIPDFVSYMMLAQPIISAVWIFLFFLAMRKHFKIS